MLEVTTREGDDIIINSENISLVIKHNDVGISIDLYEENNDQPVRELQYWFDDFKGTP